MSYTALIADDEPIICMDMADTLSAAGVQVVGQAADGFDAVELARRFHPNVVLMDIAMPVFDGLTAARQIIDQNLADTVILITSYCDDKFIAQAKEIGVGGYLVKPILSQSLMPTIEIALAQSERIAQVRRREQEARQKVEEQKIVGRAQAVLAKQRGISESKALALLQKGSMDKRVALAVFAQRVLDAYVDDDTVQRAKRRLMERYGLTEKAAYQRLRSRAAESGLTVSEVAHQVLFEK